MPAELASKIQIADNYIKITQVNENKGADGTIKLAVTGQSVSRFDKILRYQIRWYDSGSVQLDAAALTWTEMVVTANRAFEFAASAPSKRATRYVLELETRNCFGLVKCSVY